METSVYTKSNEVTEVSLKRFDKSYSKRFLSDTNRLKDGFELLNYLCDKFKIAPIKRLIILDKPRKQIKNGQIHGYYVRNNREIYIYNKTAKTNKIIAINRFYETLLHEFIHHYDFEKLKLSDSPHTSGFYKRITDLMKKITE